MLPTFNAQSVTLHETQKMTRNSMSKCATHRARGTRVLTWAARERDGSGSCWWRSSWCGARGAQCRTSTVPRWLTAGELSGSHLLTRAQAHTHTLVQSPMRNTNGITNSVSNADVLQNPCTAGPTIAAVPFYISYKNLPIHVVYFMRKSQYDNCRKFQDPWTKTFLWVTKARDWRDNS